MFMRAFLAMITADSIDRHRREQQYRTWVAAEEARIAVANGPRRPLFAAPAQHSEYDLRRPERPTVAPSR
jgi:hypothetical protein